MADRLTEIEEALKSVMESINGSTLPSGYQYYNTVGVVNIDDDALASDIADFPTVAIYMGEDGETGLEGEQHAYRNEVAMRLVVGVENAPLSIVDTQLPRFEINKKMNTMLSDIKAALSNNYQLNGTCDLVTYVSSERDYTENGNALRAGDLIVDVNIIYTQSRLNPNENCLY